MPEIKNDQSAKKVSTVKKGKSNELDKYIAKRVQTLRKAAGITVLDLALHLSITHQQMRKYEAGQDRISAGRLYEISNLLNVPFHSFFPISFDQDSDVTVAIEPLYFISKTIEYLKKRPHTSDLVLRLKNLISIQEGDLLDQR